MILSRDEILKNTDLPTETVSVPEWGGDVLVRALNGRERDEFEASTLLIRDGRDDGRDLRNVRAKLAAKAIVGEDGKRLFTDQDVWALGELSAAALTRVFEAVSRLSGISDRDMEELTANFGETTAASGGTPGGGGSSASPNGSV